MLRRNGNKVKKLNNAGVSLIEVVIAVTILAIVVIPFAHSFITAANTNAKSQKALRATTICENAMEIFENISIEKAVLTYGGLEDSTTGICTFSVTGDELGEVNGSDYEIDITLDPTVYSTQNQLNVTDIEAISSNGCGVFSMSPTYDATIYSNYSTLNNSARSSNPGLTRRDEAYYKANLKREIVVSVVKNGQRINAAGEYVDIIKVSVAVSYEDTGNTVLAKDKIHTEVKEIFDNSTTYETLKGVYILYTPRYSPAGQDKIIIKNENNVPFTCYVLRENTDDDNKAVGGLSTYVADITVLEDSVGPGITVNAANISNGTYSSILKLRTNLYNTNASDITTAQKYFKLTYKMTRNTGTLTWTPNAGGDAFAMLGVRSADGRSFGGASTSNRIYSMTVTVKYKGDVLATMTGTKMN